MSFFSLHQLVAILSMAPATPLAVKCGYVTLAMLGMRYIWSGNRSPKIVATGFTLIGINVVIVVLHYLMNSGLVPVTHLVYEVAENNGELALLIGGNAGLVLRILAPADR